MSAEGGGALACSAGREVEDGSSKTGKADGWHCLKEGVTAAVSFDEYIFFGKGVAREELTTDRQGLDAVTGRNDVVDTVSANRERKADDADAEAVGPSVPRDEGVENAHGYLAGGAPGAGCNPNVADLIADLDVGDVYLNVRGGLVHSEEREREHVGTDVARGVGDGVLMGDVVEVGTCGLGDASRGKLNGDSVVNKGKRDQAISGVSVGDEVEGHQQDFDFAPGNERKIRQSASSGVRDGREHGPEDG
ncbi:MAG: hypothetical protein KAJ06_09880 [Gammaproteobacteria bacterium]|nr:hypothetical protein [Gammaproteobacteria bacterium]